LAGPLSFFSLNFFSSSIIYHFFRNPCFYSSPDMKIPFSLLFALILSVNTFAAPVPNAQAGDDFVGDCSIPCDAQN
jgi:hypothetical protein